MTFQLTCGGCGKSVAVDGWDGGMWFLCSECDELAKAWAEESKREARAAKEQASSSPRYASVGSLLTWQGARDAVQTDR